jgi:hypothetical protein
MLLIGGATFVWMEASGHGIYALLNTDRPGGGDARWFVPLWQTSTRWEHYTMLSWLHLRDWINQQLLVAPVVLPSLIVVGVSLWLARREAARGRAGDPHEGVRTTQGMTAQGVTVQEMTVQEMTARGAAAQAMAEAVQPTSNIVQSARRRAEGHAGVPGVVPFLAIAAGFYWVFTFVWNPDYGGQRDWDLFSLASLPATLLLIVLLPRALPMQRYLRAGAVPLLVLQGWHTMAWIVQNTLPWQWPD